MASFLRNSIHRSEEMCRAQLFLQNESAYACVAELGELGLVQFRDLNEKVNAFQRKFVKEVRRCDEMERKLRFLENEIVKEGINMLDTGENPEAPQPREMYDLEATFEKLENELREVNKNEEMLKKNFAELTELKHILRKTQQFFDEHEGERQALSSLAGDEDLLLSAAGPGSASADVSSLIPTMERQSRSSPIPGTSSGGPVAGAGLVEQLGPKPEHLKFVAGVIQRERLPAFERLLWRACRGNVFLRQSEITELLVDASADKPIPIQKSVFIIFFQGDQLKVRVKKICEGFHANIYPCPERPNERREMSIGVMTRIEDLKTVLHQTQDHKHRVLVAAAKNVRMWLSKVRKIKAIYHTMNMFSVDVTQKCLISECWCPAAELDRIQMALRRGSDESGSTVRSILQRMADPADSGMGDSHGSEDEQYKQHQLPTYHRTNKFTRGFQALVDAYGVASYREINPAPYTMVTFPFLFALMFGDAGHGAIMLAAAAYLCWNEKRLDAARIRDEIFQLFFSGRYLILLMGAFSIYTGLIYNDAFSKSFNLFGSSWANQFNPDDMKKYWNKEAEAVWTLRPDMAFSDAGPYPLGVDPVWNVAEPNKLTFLNSMKMKASIIIGIAQMTFGVVLSYHNYKERNSRLDVLWTFIPQMVFLGSIFIYLCLQIITKWIVYDYKGGYSVFGYYYPDAHCAPSLLIGLINMFMMKDRPRGFVEGNRPGGEALDNCHLNFWYPLQPFFETVFILAAAACVFIMLFAKPYMLWKEHKNGGEHRPLLGNGDGRRLTGNTNLQVVRADMMDQNGEDGGPSAEVYHHSGEPFQHRGGVDDTTSITTTECQPVHIPPAKPFNFGDIMVYQAIHTIEFALGCISHTASYLRLWALSLAHAQLSDVLWTMVFRQALVLDGYLGAISTYLVFFLFATLTLFILVLMEGLSAFLHALRLHWVEFQSKFYAGTGRPFVPFSFDIILAEAKVAEDLDISHR